MSRRLPLLHHPRMMETGAHLADHVIARLPMRQWMPAVPKRLRLSPGAHAQQRASSPSAFSPD